MTVALDVTLRRASKSFYVLPEASILREINTIDDMRHNLGVRDPLLILPRKTEAYETPEIGSEIIVHIGKVTRVSDHRVTSPQQRLGQCSLVTFPS